MKVEIKWDDDAVRRVTKEATDKALALGVEEVERRARALRCPVHGTGPTRITAAREGGKAVVKIEGCCEALTDQVSALV